MKVDFDVEHNFVLRSRTCVTAAVPMDLVKIGRKTLCCGVKVRALACCHEARYKGRDNMIPSTRRV